MIETKRRSIPAIRVPILVLLATLAALLAGAATPAAADPPPDLTITPGSFDFGAINVGGELGEPALFTITNETPDPVTIESVGIAGANPYSFHVMPNGSTCFDPEEDGVLQQGESCTVVVIYDPDTEGPNSAVFQVVSDAPDSPDEVPLAGTGLPRLLPGVSVSPAALDFGDQRTGTESSPLEITLASSGTGYLNVGQVFLEGADPDQFAIAANGCSNRAIAGGDSCKVRVLFAPSSDGEKEATLTVVTDADGAHPKVNLSGRGVTPRPPVSRRTSIRLDRKLARPDRSGAQPVALRCVTENMDACKGRVTLRARGRALGLKRNRLVRIGSRPYSANTGPARVRVKLSRLARLAVRRRGTLRIRLDITSRQGDGSVRAFSFQRVVRR